MLTGREKKRKKKKTIFRLSRKTRLYKSYKDIFFLSDYYMLNVILHLIETLKSRKPDNSS